MLSRWMLRALERRGVDRYTIMTWESRLFSRHYQALLEVAVIAAVLLVLLLLM